MAFDYKEHYKKLIYDLTTILTESINQMPEEDMDIPLLNNDITDEDIRPVEYQTKKRKNKPFIID